MARFCHDRLFLQLHYPGIKWTDVRGKNSDVLAQSRALSSELWYRVRTRQGDFIIHAKGRKKDYSEAALGFQPESKVLQPHAPQPVGTSVGEQSGGTGDCEVDEQMFPDGTHHTECSVGSWARVWPALSAATARIPFAATALHDAWSSPGKDLNGRRQKSAKSDKSASLTPYSAARQVATTSNAPVTDGW